MKLSLCSRLLLSRFAALTLAGLLVVTLNADRARAQGAPDSVSFQGLLTNPGGTPINTTTSMTFNLYKNGTVVWTEVQPAVVVTDGVFNVLLGSVTPLDTVAFNQPIDLGITVGADPEISPRTPLASAPFALGMRGMYAFWADDGPNEGYNVIGGAPNNSVVAGSVGATISGGGGIFLGIPRPNTVNGDLGTVGGGGGNAATGDFATVGGGLLNTASNNHATVGGGKNNTASGSNATVGGGQDNTASNGNSTVGGGLLNTASGFNSWVGGGLSNTASGNAATVGGGLENSAQGVASFAAGHDAKAIHDGTFVWNDRSIITGDDSLVSTGVNQFLIRAAGGVGINMNAPAHPLHIGTDSTNGNGAHLTVGGTWTNVSSRSFKAGFEEIDKIDVLQRLASLEVTKWHYRGEEEFVHIGPVAEDFREAFGLGHDERYITTVDADGVALAAIKGLYEMVVALQAEVAVLKQGSQTIDDR